MRPRAPELKLVAAPLKASVGRDRQFSPDEEGAEGDCMISVYQGRIGELGEQHVT